MSGLMGGSMSVEASPKSTQSHQCMGSGIVEVERPMGSAVVEAQEFKGFAATDGQRVVIATKVQPRVTSPHRGGMPQPMPAAQPIKVLEPLIGDMRPLVGEMKPLVARCRGSP